MSAKAERRYLPMQPGDVRDTSSDPGLLLALTGGQPKTDVATGVRNFVDWYHQYYT